MAYEQCFTKNSTVLVTAGYPNYNGGGYHGGGDTVLSPDTNIYAPAAGTVVRAWHWQGGIQGLNSWGNHILVQMSQYEYWLAAHMADQRMTEGTVLNAGDFCGVQGSTGNSTGPHVHWEKWSGGYGINYRVNPFPMLGIPNALGTYDVVWSGGEGGGQEPEPIGDIVFTPGPGTFNYPIEVSMSSDIEGTIYYTTAGGFPTIGDPNTFAYEGPIKVEKGSTAFVVGVYKPDGSWTEWSNALYVILEEDPAEEKKKHSMPVWMMLWNY